jgi:chromosome segregation ATPase
MPEEIVTPLGSWLGLLVSLATAMGLGSVLTALASRPSRQSVEATAAKDQAQGEAAVITATATAFTEVTSGLREEIERLQQVAVRFEADLAAAHDRIVAAEKRAAQLTRDLDRVRGERDAALAKVELQNGEIRQLQQVITSLKREEAPVHG